MLGFNLLRSFSLAAFVTLAPVASLIERAAAEETVFEYIPSTLGIDYRELAPSPLAEMLSQGEVEWLKNAREDYAEDTEEVWSEEIASTIASGKISILIIENLQDFTPQMLTSFAAGLDHQNPTYGGLWSIGNAFIASKLAETVQNLD